MFHNVAMFTPSLWPHHTTTQRIDHLLHYSKIRRKQRSRSNFKVSLLFWQRYTHWHDRAWIIQQPLSGHPTATGAAGRHSAPAAWSPSLYTLCPSGRPPVMAAPSCPPAAALSHKHGTALRLRPCQPRHLGFQRPHHDTRHDELLLCGWSARDDIVTKI